MSARVPAAERRLQLLSAAERTFAEHGWHRSRVDDIAEAAGVSTALIFQHWPSKEALFDEVRTRLAERYQGRLEEARRHAGTEAETIQRLVETSLAFYKERPGAKIIFSPATTELAAASAAIGTSEVQDVIEDAIVSAGTPVDADLLILAGEVAAGAIRGFLTEVDFQGDTDLEAATRTATVMMVGGWDALSRLARGQPLEGAAEILEG